ADRPVARTGHGVPGDRLPAATGCVDRRVGRGSRRRAGPAAGRAGTGRDHRAQHHQEQYGLDSMHAAHLARPIRQIDADQAATVRNRGAPVSSSTPAAAMAAAGNTAAAGRTPPCSTVMTRAITNARYPAMIAVPAARPRPRPRYASASASTVRPAYHAATSIACPEC